MSDPESSFSRWTLNGYLMLGAIILVVVAVVLVVKNL